MSGWTAGAIIGAAAIVTFGVTRNIDGPAVHWLLALAVAAFVASIVYRKAME